MAEPILSLSLLLLLLLLLPLTPLPSSLPSQLTISVPEEILSHFHGGPIHKYLKIILGDQVQAFLMRVNTWGREVRPTSVTTSEPNRN